MWKAGAVQTRVQARHLPLSQPFSMNTCGTPAFHPGTGMKPRVPMKNPELAQTNPAFQLELCLS